MQTTSLTPHEVASIARALDSQARERGTRILGSQLGLIISETVRPKSLRELGGVRALASTDLRDFLQVATAELGSKDIAFDIRTGAQLPIPYLNVPTSPVEVAGRDLWRFFSNPKLACRLSVTPTGAVFVQELGQTGPDGTAVLQRPDSEAYRTLARQFAEGQQEPLRSELISTLAGEDFYNAWIGSLRKLRTSESNLLKQWEILRTEHVAQKLYEALAAAGVDDARVAEMVAVARPVSAPARVPLVMNAVTRPRVGLPGKPQGSAGPLDKEKDFNLRELIHLAVEMMSTSELREVRIPAGLLQDAFRSISR